MSYSSEFEPRLRFGDLVESLPAAHIQFKGANWKSELEALSVSLEMLIGYSVVLSPCCEIGGENRYLILAPLQGPKDFSFILQNEFFREDPLRVNDLVDPVHQLPRARWEALTPQEREAREATGPTYFLNYLFAFAARAPIIPEVRIRVRGVATDLPANWAAIDFRRMYRVHFPQIADETVLAQKRLQLDIATRAQLRRKLSGFFAAVPREDLLGPEETLGRVESPTPSG